MKKSGIELLRIIAFFMVCSIHITSVGIVTNQISDHSIAWYYATLMRTFVAPAVTIFILIGGYVQSLSEKYDVKIKFKRILLPLMFYIPVLISYSLEQGTTLMETFLNLLNVFGSFYHLWYVVVYLLIIYIFCNIKPRINLTKRVYKKLIIPLLMITVVSKSVFVFFGVANFFDYLCNKLIFYFLIYCIGYGIGKYNIKVKKIYLFLIFCFSLLIEYLLFLNHNPMGSVINLSISVDTMQIFNVINGLCLFLFFKDLSFNSKAVNFLGKLVYGSYLIHIIFIYYGQNIFPYLSYVDSRFYFVYDMLFICFVMLCSFVVEFIRIKIIDLYNYLKLKIMEV